MKSLKDVNSAEKALALENILYAFPYLGMFGFIGGYASSGLIGALIGLIIDAVASSTIGTASSIFTGKASDSAINIFYGLGRRTINHEERGYNEYRQTANSDFERHASFCRPVS
jgi:hypothetical protein